MDREAHDHTPSAVPPPLAAALAALLCVGVVTAVAWWLHNGPAPGAAQTQPAEVPPLFSGWQKPDVTLLLSGEAHGYLQPCGCSRPQKGGLARRYTFLESLRKKGWPVVAVDLGDLPQPGHPQSLLKYEFAMKALKIMDYSAVTFGELEMRMPLVDALAATALNKFSPPVVTSNLDLTNPGDVFQPMVTVSEVVGSKGPRVGVAALVAPSVEKTIKGKDPIVRFIPRTDLVLRETLEALAKQKADLVVLLYQGSQKEAQLCANHCAQERAKNPAYPRVDVILCLDVADEPAGIARQVGNSMIVSVGHKGRYVGVVGAYRTNKPGQPWELRYQLVPIGEEFETAAGREKSNPVMGIMEEYAETVKAGDYLSKYPRKKHPIQLDKRYEKSEYVGSEKCAGCHPHAFAVWDKSHHSHAYESLAKAKRPSNRQFDGECIVCHTVGFAYETGFNSAVALKKQVPLEGVGCESCHGPGSMHAKNPNDKELRALMNTWKSAPNQKQRLNLIDRSCVQCHDIDNDVHWNFEKNWPEVEHKDPKKKVAGK